MNSDWISFLKSNNASFLENSKIIFSDNQEAPQNSITALAHFGILKVTGTDANQFLQGQLTCDINELTESNSFFAALCNAKGRTICTLLVLKTSSDFLLILPAELIDKVSNKLQMYIMRSDVQLSNISNDMCLIGINTQTTDKLNAMPQTTFAVIQQNKQIFIKFPLLDNRCLIIASPDDAISLWTDLIKSNFMPCSSNSWLEQDISAGMPWLSLATSEDYIPQMLNIDKLGGISFNKGCYTGQEIIARTHYLGKAKRELFLAYCDNTAEIDSQTQIITNNGEQTVGKVLSLISNEQHIKMLIVMQSTDTELNSLMLNNSNQDKINIIDFR